MIEVMVLIPVTSNEGETFGAAHHVAFEAFVLARFGGITRLPGAAAGSWLDNGAVFTDATIVYVIAVTGLVAQSTALREVVEFAKAHYAQLAIYVRYLGLSEVL